ncbi:MAG: flagellar assembly protein FliX [Rhodomicrobium sp.]|nr:MAG: flagellar assembly protein FliX [Rhodomicrobium sp.]
MRIEGPRQVGKAGKKSKNDKNGASGARFTLESGPSTGGLSGTNAAQSINNIGTLLAAQEVDQRSDTVEKTVKRGNDMLDILDQMKLGILSGRVSPQNLQKLRRLSGEKPLLEGHEGLSKVMQSIELRAEVELAKLASRKMR